MEYKYVQLPPLALDTPLECIEMIWLYARMPSAEKKRIMEFMRENVKSDTGDINKTELAKMMNDPEMKIAPDVEEFNSLMRQLIGTLMAQACELSAMVYRHYCLEGKSITEISKETNVPEYSVKLMAQYYERKRNK